MPDNFTLEESWTAQSSTAYKIDFRDGGIEDDHFCFVFTATKDDGEFIFKAQISPKLVEKLGIDPEGQKNKLMKVAAGQGLTDLKVRLNAGHDVNFEGLPYIKAYTLRDKPNFERFL